MAALATGQSRRDGHHQAQTGQTPNVARATFVVHDTGGHEQRGLERGVIHDVKHRRHRGQLAVEAQQQGDQPQMEIVEYASKPLRSCWNIAQ